MNSVMGLDIIEVRQYLGRLIEYSLLVRTLR